MSFCCLSYLCFYGVSIDSDVFVLNRTDLTWLGLCHNIVETFLRNIFIVGLCIALKLIEYQRLVECWAVYCSEIDRRSETCLMLGCILLLSWYKIRGLLNAGLYIALKSIEYQRLVECFDCWLVIRNTCWECCTVNLVSLQIKDSLYQDTLQFVDVELIRHC